MNVLRGVIAAVVGPLDGMPLADFGFTLAASRASLPGRDNLESGGMTWKVEDQAVEALLGQRMRCATMC